MEIELLTNTVLILEKKVGEKKNYKIGCISIRFAWPPCKLSQDLKMIWCLILLCVIDAWGKGGYWHLESKVIISLVLAKSKGWISIQMLLLIGDSAKATYTVTCKVSGPSPFELWPSFAFSPLSLRLEKLAALGLNATKILI